MKEFTSEFIEEQLDKWHNSTNDEWLTECWNNYGLALEYLRTVLSDLHMHELWHTHYKDECSELQQRIAELEQERRWIHQDKTMIVKKDGNSWCFVLPDFIDLQESEFYWSKDLVSIHNLDKFLSDVYERLTQPPKEGE